MHGQTRQITQLNRWEYMSTITSSAEWEILSRRITKEDSEDYWTWHRAYRRSFSFLPTNPRASDNVTGRKQDCSIEQVALFEDSSTITDIAYSCFRFFYVPVRWKLFFGFLDILSRGYFSKEFVGERIEHKDHCPYTWFLPSNIFIERQLFHQTKKELKQQNQTNRLFSYMDLIRVHFMS